jgi:hypothetical protein
MMNVVTKVISITAIPILVSCASVPSDYPKPPSFALEDTRTTELGRRVSELSFDERLALLVDAEWTDRG